MSRQLQRTRAGFILGWSERRGPECHASAALRQAGQERLCWYLLGHSSWLVVRNKWLGVVCIYMMKN